MIIPYFDCHCDTVVEANMLGEGLRKSSSQLDLTRLAVYSPCAQVFAVCTSFKNGADCNAQTYINSFLNELRKNSDIASLCLNQSDIDAAVHQGKIAALLSIEGAEQILSLDKAYRYGVRIIHPVWNIDNQYCGSAMGSGAGLSEKGKGLVTKCQSMGIMLDMSHISERGFWDTLKIAEKPVIAGHSNSKSLCNVPRNLNDCQYKALVQCGGGVGINLYPEFLGLTWDIDAVIAHIEHFLSLGGEKNLFLGCDFDGIDTTPKGVDGVHDMPKLYEALLKRNYKESLVRDIFWNNLYDIIGRTL